MASSSAASDPPRGAGSGAGAGSDPASTPPAHTLERWAWDFVRTTDLAAKLAPPPPPRCWEDDPPARQVRPGRAPELVLTRRAQRAPRPGALRRPERRAQLVHTFWHHEVQAAELFAWALLAFPDTPRAFRRGLAALVREELRHAALYAEHLVALGSAPGRFPVRDWFWERVPTVARPAGFVALVGLGLEAANLEHAERFAAAFRAAGDERAAALCERIGADEIAHVRFARRWFERWCGPLTFERWRRELPDPLTPTVLRGPSLNRAARTRAGCDAAFLEALDGWSGRPGGPPAS